MSASGTWAYSWNALVCNLTFSGTKWRILSIFNKIIMYLHKKNPHLKKILAPRKVHISTICYEFPGFLENVYLWGKNSTLKKKNSSEDNSYFDQKKKNLEFC